MLAEAGLCFQRTRTWKASPDPCYEEKVARILVLCEKPPRDGPVGSRQGTRTYKGKVCWHPLLCFVGETGEWLHARLRNGHAAASTEAATANSTAHST